MNSSHSEHRLDAYRPPEYLIPEARLEFDFFEDKTRVLSRLEIRRAVKETVPLVLCGEKMKLIRLHLNGRQLGADDYHVDDATLTIPDVPESFTLTVENEILPHENEALEGLYRIGDLFCTQNESEGFRKITYFADRPDVLTRFTTVLRADRARYPLLLSNGNEIGREDLRDGRHAVTWEDPHPKPCYLFALVAGDLDFIEDAFVTRSGRKVRLRIFTDKGREEKARYAMDCLKRAMRWDEETFGLEVDLDDYMIVAVSAFNFGAMENKGLNIFNDQYVLADPDTATDQNYQAIEGVVGHEYFHNWTGNRVTCRDWFQITLKEGLTILRDQEFSSDMGSRPVTRIANVRVLRDYQFPEDAGPNAHPIRPETYIEVNNFYTATVYNKGAEVIRMIETLIGREAFRRGITRYFELFDGQAVTTEDFVRAMEDASGRNLAQFRRWYRQPGTPRCFLRGHYDEKEKTYTLEVEQKPPQGRLWEEGPLEFPLTIELLRKNGGEIPLAVEGMTESPLSSVLSVFKDKQSFVFRGVEEPVIPSLFRNFSAPVHFEFDYGLEDLALLLAHDSDPFNRYEAGQRLALRSLGTAMKIRSEGGQTAIDPAVLDAFGRLIASETTDPALRAEIMIMPSLTALVERTNPCDFDGAFQARESLLLALGCRFRALWMDVYRRYQVPGPYSPRAEDIGRRSWKNTALSYLVMSGGDEAVELALRQFREADNMTDRMAALAPLSHLEHPARDEALTEFRETWQRDSLVMNKWFAVQALSKRKDTLASVLRLTEDPVYDAKNPNKIRSLVGAFSQNLSCFHASDGSGYAFLADRILEIESFNPGVAAKLAGAFRLYPRLDEKRRAVLTRELERILARPGLSGDVYEIVSKTAAAGANAAN